MTDADEAVEDALRAMLATDRPGDSVLGEERGLTGLSERRWIIDGIDGTDSFAAGRSEWGTLIALQVDGDVVVGVADAPVFGRRFWATRGGGTYAATDEERTPLRLGVNRGVDIHQCRVIVPPLSWCRDDRDVAAANRVAMATRPAAPTEHPAIQVAMGGCEAAIFFRTGPWDIAAPALIVEEAGGKFTDLDGHRRLDSGCAVYSNGLIHDELLRLLSS